MCVRVDASSGTEAEQQMGRGGVQGGIARPVVAVEGGRKVLRVGGIIQSVHVDETYTPDIWDAMLPEKKPRNALILGLGGGTMATLLTRRWGDLPITGIERDPAVALLARTEFGLARHEHVRILVADAFEWIARCDERYDTICVDLYTAGKMAHGVLGTNFLWNVARALAPGGTVTFNLWRSPYLEDQVRRLARVFVVEERISVEDNVVIRCTLPA